MLPLVAKGLVDGGPGAFGLLVGSLGAGAVAGALVLPRLRAKLSRDALVASASVVYALALVALASFDRLAPLCLAMALAGLAWISVLSSLQVAAQMALPNWVRSRGLAVFMTVFMGSMAGGSLLWGTVAARSSVPEALLAAAAGLVIAVALTWRWRISGFEDVDLAPSMHWPAPVTHESITHDRGPVLVTLTYAVRPDARAEFLALVRTLGGRRRRDGAFAWGVFENTEQPDRFIESFCVASWLDHLRQHERVTSADRDLQTQIRELLSADGPVVAHYVAPDKTEIPS
jgi:hypothetical protein